MARDTQSIDSMLLRRVKKHSRLTIAMAIVILLMGVFAMASPFLVGVSLAIALGFMLIIGGAGQLLFALKAQAGLFSIILAALTILAGAFMVSKPGSILATMTLILAIYFLVSGVFEVLIALQIKPTRGWGWALFNGAASVFLGTIIWSQFPVSGTWTIGLLIGIKLFLSGWTLLMFGLIARSIAKELA